MSDSALSPIARVQRGLIIALVVMIALTAVSGASLVFVNITDDTAGMFIGIPALLVLCLGLLVAFSAVWQRPCTPAMRMALIIGAALAVGSTILCISLIVSERDHDYRRRESMAMLVAAGYAIATALAYTGALAQVRTESKLVRGMCVATGLGVWVAAGALCLLLLIAETVDGDFGFMIFMSITMAIASLITLAGTIAVPVALASGAAKRRVAAESIDPRVQVRFGCPKCGERQTHRPGFAKCPQCATGLFIEVEEPRCECGYLLYQLTGDHCPECGKPVVGANLSKTPST